MSNAETPAAAAPPPPSAGGSNGLLTFNLLWGIVGLVVGWAIGLAIGHRMASRFDWIASTDQNDIAILLGYVLATVGYLGGLGIFNHPVARLFGRPGGDLAKGATGWTRYVRASTDHKVIGLQYLMGIAVFFFIGGLNAMLIRVELLRATTPTFSPGEYLTLVGLHGSMMIMMVSSIILGPFGHYFVPLMIGSPAPRGALVLAAAPCRRRAHDDHHLRRLPNRLDRLPDARRPG
jgi:cytochrome c oxidase subunit 1